MIVRYLLAALVAGMIAGARLGIAILMDDSPRTLLSRSFRALLSRGKP